MLIHTGHPRSYRAGILNMPTDFRVPLRDLEHMGGRRRVEVKTGATKLGTTGKPGDGIRGQATLFRLTAEWPAELPACIALVTDIGSSTPIRSASTLE
jgi:hypothetical protein